MCSSQENDNVPVMLNKLGQKGMQLLQTFNTEEQKMQNQWRPVPVKSYTKTLSPNITKLYYHSNIAS